MPRTPLPLSRRAAATLVLAFAAPILGGCEAEAIELAQEVAAARGDCTAQGLRESDEECVRMMERYAGMGTELVHTYIGGLKTLDRALDRLPPPEFDTAGLGYAISPVFRNGHPLGHGASPRLRSRAAGAGTTAPGFGRAPRPGSDGVAPTTPLGRSAAFPAERERSSADGRFAGAVQRAYGESSLFAPRDAPAWSRLPRAPAAAVRNRRPIRDRGRYEPFGYRASGWRGYSREDGWWGGVGGGWPYGSPYNYLYNDGRSFGADPLYGYFNGYGGGYGYSPGYPGSGTPMYGYEPASGYPGRPADRYGFGGGYSDHGASPYGYGDPEAYGPYEYRPHHPPTSGGWKGGNGYDDYRSADARDDLSPQEDWRYAPADPEPLDDEYADPDGLTERSSIVPARPAPHRPGILLPPEERLRRPWLAD